MAKRYSKYFPLFFLTADLVSLNSATVIANFLKFGSLFSGFEYWLEIIFILNLLWVLTFFSTHLQETTRESKLIDYLNRFLSAVVINLFIVFAIWFIAKPFYYSRQHLFYLYLAFTSLSISWRVVWYYFIRYYRSKGYNTRKVVVVGLNEVSRDLVDYFKNNPGFGYDFLGFFDDKKRDEGLVRPIRDLRQFVQDEKVDVIYVYLPRIPEHEMQELIDFADNNLVKVKIISQFSKLGTRSMSVQNYGSIPVLNISAIPLDNMINRSIKRAFDIVFSSVVLVFIMSWLIPIVGLLIKLESRGPIFFKQYRNGLNNQKFLIYKFRTMVVHTDQNVVQAKKNDSRITKFGAILRKTSLDEFPQFINVFLGDMSVVGPRPHAVKHNEEYGRKIDRFIQRHAVKPGITGLAQAKGFRGETAELNDMVNRVKLDRFYVKNWSLVLDMKIILLTIISILRGSEKAF